ncbi:MAG: LPD38 domain-containing protein, partial [Comamonas sp.]
IPMPLGFHVFPNIGRKLVEFGFHDNPHEGRMSHVADLMLASVNAFNPLGGADNFMQMLAPTPFDPVAALMENKDWTGRQIYREQTSHLDPKPGHDMAKESANRFVVSISRGLNAATGGNDWQRGALSLNPDAMEYVFGQITGGVGRELAKAGNSVTAVATGDELAAHKIPLFGRVYGNTRGVNGQSEGFYSNLQRINVAESEAKGRYANGESVDAALASAPLSQLGTVGNQVQKRVKELGQFRNRMLKSDVPDKAEQVKLINQEIEQTMYRLNSLADEVARESTN